MKLSWNVGISGKTTVILNMLVILQKTRICFVTLNIMRQQKAAIDICIPPPEANLHPLTLGNGLV